MENKKDIKISNAQVLKQLEFLLKTLRANTDKVQETTISIRVKL